MITCAPLGVSPGGARAEDWPQFRGPRNDGTWHAPPLAEQWPDSGLKTRWRTKIGGGYSGVTSDAGRVYTLDRQTEPAEIERVLCFEGVSGRLLWEHRVPVHYGKLDYGNGPRAAATIHDGRVYTLGTMGHARCLDAQTGRVIWARDFVAESGAHIPTWGLAASPLIHRDWVLYHAGIAPGGCLVALDRATGEEVWRGGDDPAGYATPVVAMLGGREQAVVCCPRHVLGFDIANGKVLWKIPYEVTYGVSIATPIVDAGRIVVCGYWEGSKAIRIGPRPDQAELAWEDRTGLQGLMSQPLVRNGIAYLIDKDQGLVAFELATGKRLWDDEHRLTPRNRNPHAALVWLGDTERALALNAEGELVQCRLSPQGYEELARSKLLGPTWAHPGFADNMVFARNDEELVAAELPPP